MGPAALPGSALLLPLLLLLLLLPQIGEARGGQNAPHAKQPLADITGRAHNGIPQGLEGPLSKEDRKGPVLNQLRLKKGPHEGKPQTPEQKVSFGKDQRVRQGQGEGAPPYSGAPSALISSRRRSVQVESPPGSSGGSRGGPPGVASSSIAPIGAIKRLENLIRNSSIVDRLVSLFRYFAGPTPGRPDKALLRQSDSVGVGVGLVVHVLRLQPPESQEALSRHIKAAPDVKRFIDRFIELGDGKRTIRESLQQLLWARRTCARIALGSYDAQQQGDFMTLVEMLKQEYLHILGFTAKSIANLPQGLPALSLVVDHLLVPLQDALRSIASVSGRFKGFAVALAQQQLLRWIQHLSRLDAALLQLLPGGGKALASLQTISSYETTLEEIESSNGSHEGDYRKEGLDSHL